MGWIISKDLFLEPEASFRATQGIGTANGDPIAVGSKTLAKRLHERKLLVATDAGRGKLTVRRTLEGTRRNVLHLAADVLEEPAQSAPSVGEPAIPPWTPVADGPILRADSPTAGRESAQANRPTDSRDQEDRLDSGPVGPIGPIPSTPSPNGVTRRQVEL